MPLGVEHIVGERVSKDTPEVSQPLMPLGVEHS